MPMTPDENKALLKRVFDETARGNGRPFVDMLADDVRWTIIGSTAWSRTYTGKHAVLSELLAAGGELRRPEHGQR
jgi:uncharacterized protein